VLDSSRFIKLLAELETFGAETQIKCDDAAISFKSKDGPISMSATLPQSDMVEYALPEESVNEVFSSKFLVTAAGFAKLSRYASVPKNMEVHINVSRPAQFTFTLGTGEHAPIVRTMVAPRMADNECVE
jgi:hypothetical protein